MVISGQTSVIVVVALHRHRVHFGSEEGQEQVEDVNAEAVGNEIPPLTDHDATQVRQGQEYRSDPSVIGAVANAEDKTAVVAKCARCTKVFKLAYFPRFFPSLQALESISVLTDSSRDW